MNQGADTPEKSNCMGEILGIKGETVPSGALGGSGRSSGGQLSVSGVPLTKPFPSDFSIVPLIFCVLHLPWFYFLAKLLTILRKPQPS